MVQFSKLWGVYFNDVEEKLFHNRGNTSHKERREESEVYLNDMCWK